MCLLIFINFLYVSGYFGFCIFCYIVKEEKWPSEVADWMQIIIGTLISFFFIGLSIYFYNMGVIYSYGLCNDRSQRKVKRFLNLILGIFIFYYAMDDIKFIYPFIDGSNNVSQTTKDAFVLIIKFEFIYKIFMGYLKCMLILMVIGFLTFEGNIVSTTNSASQRDKLISKHNDEEIIEINR